MGTAHVIRQRLHRGVRLGRFTIWTGWRGSRHWEVEDVRPHGGNCIMVTAALRPTEHSDLNFLISIRVR